MANTSKPFQNCSLIPNISPSWLGILQMAQGSVSFHLERIEVAKVGFRIDQGAMHGDGSYNLVIQQNGVAHGETLASTTVGPNDTGEDVAVKLSLPAETN